MLPGVELARKRRVHHRLDGWARSSPPEPTTYSSARHPFSLRSPPTGMDESARAARLRLEEKLRGMICSHRSSPSSDSHRRGGQSRWIGDRRRASTVDSAAGDDRVADAPGTMPNPNQYGILGRSGSRVDLCAVCLDEVEATQRITCLPCSHKYHTECLVPWLAAHSHCPCCRTLVPAIDLPS